MLTRILRVLNDVDPAGNGADVKTADGAANLARRPRQPAWTWGVPSGTPCIAPFPGTITYVATTGFDGGGMIHLQTPVPVPGTSLQAGDKTGWGHIGKSLSHVGRRVRAGQRIATSSGSPPHVHFVLIRPGAGGNGIDGSSDPTEVCRQLGGV